VYCTEGIQHGFARYDIGTDTDLAGCHTGTTTLSLCAFNGKYLWRAHHSIVKRTGTLGPICVSDGSSSASSAGYQEVKPVVMAALLELA